MKAKNTYAADVRSLCNFSIGTLGGGEKIAKVIIALCLVSLYLEPRPLTLAFNNYQYVHTVMSRGHLTVEDKKPICTSVGTHPLGTADGSKFSWVRLKSTYWTPVTKTAQNCLTSMDCKWVLGSKIQA